MTIFAIETDKATGEFRVIEFTADGFHVLATYEDREIAEDRMAAWKKEAGF